jgi:hypothetical protein
MESEGRSGVVWVVAALAITLFCCLVLVVAAGVGSFLIIQRGDSVPLPRATSAATEPVFTPVSPPDDTSEIPQAAYDMDELLFETVVPIADQLDLAERLSGVGDIPRVMATEAEPVEIGTVHTFWASNTDTDETFEVEARMVYATEHVYFWVEEGVDVRQSEVETLVDEFEDKIYPTDRNFFGTEWSPGIDGDEHLYILFARGLGFSLAGYFNSSDSFPPEVNEFSNGHEMFYLSADNLDLTRDFTLGVLAHEFQHMIHWNLDANEMSWMNEGFSEVAVLLNDYDLGGFDHVYADQPDQILAYWPSEPGTSAGHYGQAFLFLAYYLQRFGSEATQAVVRHVENGLDSIDLSLVELGEIDSTTGEVMTADDLYRDWATAMVLQDPSLEDGRYGISIYDFPPVARLSDNFTECPVEEESRSVFPYGVDYIRVVCDSPHTLRLDGANLTQVIPAEAHSGDFAFWSNKGDTSDMTMTREFDLSGLSGPVEFSYWVWYDIEENWDYLYLEASSDGGETWDILVTPSGTDSDPQGNSYGWGYTGLSGSGGSAQWVEESVDLSDYAGGDVLLRFEYVTDAAVNGEGLLLDDLTIDAIGYEEGFETDEGGWEGAGFVRLFNRLPQTYRLVLIEQGAETRIRDIPWNEARDAEVSVAFGDGVDEAILVIINTARDTWQASPYTFEVVP